MVAQSEDRAATPAVPAADENLSLALWPGVAPTEEVDFLAGGTVGFGLGETSEARAILVTEDGGRTWRLVGVSPVPDVQRIDFLSRDLGHVAATGAAARVPSGEPLTAEPRGGVSGPCLNKAAHGP